MSRSEDMDIIKNYRPRIGFFDLSKTPVGMRIKEHAKIIRCQEHLFFVSDNISYFEKFDKIGLGNAKELSAKLQRIIIYKWRNIMEVDE